MYYYARAKHYFVVAMHCCGNCQQLLLAAVVVLVHRQGLVFVACNAAPESFVTAHWRKSWRTLAKAWRPRS